MVYYRYAKREYPGIIIASAYAPDTDIAADSEVLMIGIVLLEMCIILRIILEGKEWIKRMLLLRRGCSRQEP